MSNFRSTKTYERFSHKYKRQQSKLLSDLFDKVAGNNSDKGKHKSNYDSHEYSGSKEDRARLLPSTKKKKKVRENREGGTGSRVEEGEGAESGDSSITVKDPGTGAGASSPCALFQSLTDSESKPKKAKSCKMGRGTKTSRLGVKQRQLYNKLKKAVRGSTPIKPPPPHHSPDFPSVETFRDIRKSRMKWSLGDADTDLACSVSPDSLSPSFSHTLTPSTCGQDRKTVTPSLCRQEKRTLTPSAWSAWEEEKMSWAPAGVRQRSFVKIKTPAATQGLKHDKGKPHTVTHEEDEEDIDDDDDDDDSSYTSVYTWVTATNTDTGGTVKTPHKEREIVSGSPSLVWKSGVKEQLQSTILPSHPPLCELQDTPHLSPITPAGAAYPHRRTPRASPAAGHDEEEERHRTPSAPTHSLSPRGPRKSQSFLSVRSRGVAPKCSTMLFASPLPHAGDAPLDVSSIRMALSEAMDLKNVDQHQHQHQDLSHHHAGSIQGDRVLTSTPCGPSTKLKWNVSSVGAVREEEEELRPLDSSGDTVNSEEIMADSVSEVGSPVRLATQAAAAVDTEEAESGVGLSCQDMVPAASPLPPSLHALPLPSPLPATLSPSPCSHAGASPSPLAVSTHAAPLPSPLSPPPLKTIASHSNIQTPSVSAPSVCVNQGSKHVTPTLPAKSSKHVVSPLPAMSSKYDTSSVPSTSKKHATSSVPSMTDQVDGRGDGQECVRQSEAHSCTTDTRRVGKDSQAHVITSTAGKKRGGKGGRKLFSGDDVEWRKDDGCVDLMSGLGHSTVGGRKTDSEVQVFTHKETRSIGDTLPEEEDGISPCPVSTTSVWRGEKGRGHPASGLLMWVEPADSGFLDMISNTPPDIVHVVSQQAKEKRLSSAT